MSITPELILFCVYLLLGPVAWMLFGFSMFNGRSQMLLVKRPVDKLPNPPPRVTILIPVKDEGPRIRDCVTSALNQDYPNFHVIAIDDRSTDDTPAILDEMAQNNSNLQVIHIRQGDLPPGWTGKCNALQTGVKHADGQWLLFVDSDVVLQPDALSATVERAAKRLYDLLSFLPKLESHSLWEGVLIPLAAAGVTFMYAVSFTNKDYLQNSAFANGQYLFIRRKTYDEMGGHERVKDKFCEDVEIARYLKAQGCKVRISWGTQFVAVRMYNSLSSIFRGWSRSFYAGSLGRPWRILAGIAFIIFCCYTAYIATGLGIFRLLRPSPQLGRYAWLTAAAFHLVLMHALVAVMYYWSGNRRRGTCLFPVGAALMIGIFLKALRMCFTKRVEWRGTSYTHTMQPRALQTK